MRGLYVVALALPLALGLPAGASAERPPAVVTLGRFATTYANDAEHKSRAFNVAVAAEAIDGKVVPANATFSFNDAVGERTATFGFEKSVVIRNGMIAEGMGGGTCQVASTLHAAALLSGLDIVSRAPHTRPSAYIRMGLDATVVYPTIDLKLKNPTAAAVTIHARAARGVLDVWLAASGIDKPNVSVATEIVERMPFGRVVERDKSLHDENVHVKAFGIPGYRVRRTREIKGEDGEVRRDVRVDVYPPTSFVVRVAPTVDASRSDAGDDDEPLAPVASRIVDAGVVRPVLVQLRPSKLVELDNALSTSPAP